jgi:CrcB protein
VGGVGAAARFVLDGVIGQRLEGSAPVGTFVVNISGTIALGLVTGLALRGTALLLVGTAALGSYTTFSTWVFESQRLAEDGEPAGTFANVALSLLAGVMAAALGHAIGTQL